MQTYPLALAASNNFGTRISSLGSQIVFESGTSAGDSHIRVKTDTGDDIELKPGQQVRFVKPVTQWFISSLDGTSAITGKLIIGDGDFTDSNISNTFKLDGGFANTVTVNNTTAQRIPVSLGAGPIETTDGPMKYTKSYASTTGSAVNTPIKMLSEVVNVNGAVLNKFSMSSGSFPIGSICAVIAKATAPVGIADGDVLISFMSTSAGVQQFDLDISKQGQPQVPAGMAIWYISSNTDSCNLRSALFTVL